MQEEMRRQGDDRKFQISDCKLQIENIGRDEYFVYGVRNFEPLKD
jgi:hypothetical protein